MLLVMIVIAFECFLMPFLYVAPLRFKIFTGELMKQFSDDHKKAYGTSTIPPGGFPDTGEGRFCEKMNFHDWFKFNCAQRGHGNFVEHLPVILLLILVGGLSFPRYTALIGLFYSAGRFIYARGYYKHPSGRSLGAQIADYILLI